MLISFFLDLIKIGFSVEIFPDHGQKLVETGFIRFWCGFLSSLWFLRLASWTSTFKSFDDLIGNFLTRGKRLTSEKMQNIRGVACVRFGRSACQWWCNVFGEIHLHKITSWKSKRWIFFAPKIHSKPYTRPAYSSVQKMNQPTDYFIPLFDTWFLFTLRIDLNLDCYLNS